MAASLSIHAHSSRVDLEHLPIWELSISDENALLEWTWLERDVRQCCCERVFLVQPDVLRPLVNPIRGLSRRYVYPMDGISMRSIDVKDGSDEFSCVVAGYHPRDFPELQHFENLWRNLWKIVARELEGHVPSWTLKG